MPPKRRREITKKQTKNFVVLSPYKFKELLENGTIKFESAHIDISRIQEPANVIEPEVNFSMSNYFGESDPVDKEEPSFKDEYDEQDYNNDLSDNMVETADQEVPTLKKLKGDYYTIRKCLECNKEFISYKKFKRHYTEHHPHVPIPEKFICQAEQCSFKTDDKQNYYIHKKVHDPTGSRGRSKWSFQYRCAECDTHFKTELARQIHVNCVHRKLPSICPVCQRLSKNLAALSIHIKRHLHENIFKCEQCNATFRMKANKIRHVEAVHDKQRRFECLECGKRFAQKKTMELHVQTVHLKIPYLPWLKKNKNRKKKVEKQENDLAE